jgi:hypothetical protein
MLINPNHGFNAVTLPHLDKRKKTKERLYMNINFDYDVYLNNVAKSRKQRNGTVAESLSPPSSHHNPPLLPLPLQPPNSLSMFLIAFLLSSLFQGKTWPS